MKKLKNATPAIFSLRIEIATIRLDYLFDLSSRSMDPFSLLCAPPHAQEAIFW